MLLEIPLHVYDEHYTVRCRIPGKHCTIGTLMRLWELREALHVFISHDGTILRHISLFSTLEEILDSHVDSIYYSINAVKKELDQPAPENLEQTFDTVELEPGEEKTIPVLPRDYIALPNFLDIFRQDIKDDYTITNATPKHMWSSLVGAFKEGYPVYMETNENDTQQVKRVTSIMHFSCCSGRYFVLYKLDGNHPAVENFYCNADLSNQDRCEKQCDACLKYTNEEQFQKLDELLDMIGCWSIGESALEDNYHKVLAYTLKDSGYTEKYYNKVLESLKDNQTIFVKLKGMNQGLLYTNDVIVMRDNLLPYIEKIYLVQELGPVEEPPTKVGDVEFYDQYQKHILRAFNITGTDDTNTWIDFRDYTTRVGEYSIIAFDKADPHTALFYTDKEFNKTKCSNWALIYVMDELFASAYKNVNKVDEPIIDTHYDNVDTIYNIGLHEVIDVDETTQIQRVPGGWIYHTIFLNADNQQKLKGGSSVFVPFHNEFQC